MPDYTTMTAVEALRHAKDVSGLTAEEIARRAGLPARVVRSYLDRGADYEPGLGKLPGLCRALGNRVLLDWLAAQCEGGHGNTPAAKDRAEVLTAVARVVACVGDVQRCLAETGERGIDRGCAREIRGLLGDVMAECRYAQGLLHDLAGEVAGDMRPLCCLKAPERRRWWRFWAGRDEDAAS